MNWYEFKLNFQKHYLDKYNSIQELISVLLERLTYTENIYIRDKNNFHIINTSLDTLDDLKTDFTSLEHSIYKLRESYETILDKYKIEKNIYYSQNFLELNEECMTQLSSFQSNYPNVKNIYSKYAESEIKEHYHLKFNSHVGTGVRSIIKFFTLKRYIEENGYDTIVPLFSFKNIVINSKNEHIYIPATNTNKALLKAESLADFINKHYDISGDIGKITILPIYSYIKIKSKGKINSVTYTIVYPNGNLPKEVSKDLWGDKNNFNAAKKTVTLQKQDGGESLDLLGINSLVSANGEKGYLVQLEANGGIVKKGLSKASFKLEKFLNELIEYFFNA